MPWCSCACRCRRACSAAAATAAHTDAPGVGRPTAAALADVSQRRGAFACCVSRRLYINSSPPTPSLLQTSILDFIRKSKVAAGEAGGITQASAVWLRSMFWLRFGRQHRAAGAAASGWRCCNASPSVLPLAVRALLDEVISSDSLDSPSSTREPAFSVFERTMHRATCEHLQAIGAYTCDVDYTCRLVH